MAFTRRGGATVTGGTTGTTLTIASANIDIVVGDLLVAFVYQHGRVVNDLCALPPGFTTIDDSSNLYESGAYGYKIALKDDETADFVFSKVADLNTVATIQVYTSDNDSYIKPDFVSSTLISGTSDPSVTPAITAAAGALAIGVMGGASTNGITTSTAGFSIADSDSINGYEAAVAHGFDVTGGSTSVSFSGTDSPYNYVNGIMSFVEGEKLSSHPYKAAYTNGAPQTTSTPTITSTTTNVTDGDLVLFFFHTSDSACNITDSDGLTVEAIGGNGTDYILSKIVDGTENGSYSLTLNGSYTTAYISNTYKYAAGYEAGTVLTQDTACTFRSSNEAETSTATTLSISKPAGLTVGDLMVAEVTKSGTDNWTSSPAGWTEQVTAGANGLKHSLEYKVATADDVAASTFSWGWAASEDAAGVIAAFNLHGCTIAYVGASTEAARLSDTTPSSTAASAINKYQLLIGSVATVNGTGSTAGLGMVTSGFTLAGNPTTGTGTGDSAALLAYKTPTDGTESIFEVNNAAATANSYVTYWNFKIFSPAAPAFTPSTETAQWLAAAVIDADVSVSGPSGWLGAGLVDGNPEMRTYSKYGLAETQENQTFGAAMPVDVKWSTWITAAKPLPPSKRWTLTHIFNTKTQNGPLNQNKNDESLVRASNGTLAGFMDVGNDLLISTDGGATWARSANDMPLTLGTYDNASMTIDENDYIHIVYEQNNNYYYYYGTPNAGVTDWSWQGTYSRTWSQVRDYPAKISIKAFDQGSDTYVILLLAESYGTSSGSLQHYRLKWANGVGGTLTQDLHTEIYYASILPILFYPYVEFRTVDGVTVDTQPDYWLFGVGPNSDKFVKYSWTGSDWTKGTTRTLGGMATSSGMLSGAYNDNDSRWSMMRRQTTGDEIGIIERDLADTTTYTETSPAFPSSNYLSGLKAGGIDRGTGDGLALHTDYSIDNVISTFYTRESDTWEELGHMFTNTDKVVSSYVRAYPQRGAAQSAGQGGFDFLVLMETLDETSYDVYYLGYSFPVASGGWGIISI